MPLSVIDPKNWTTCQLKIVYQVQYEEVNQMSERKRHSAQFKFKVALEAAKESKTLNQLAGAYELHPSQISE